MPGKKAVTRPAIRYDAAVDGVVFVSFKAPTFQTMCLISELSALVAAEEREARAEEKKKKKSDKKGHVPGEATGGAKRVFYFTSLLYYQDDPEVMGGVGEDGRLPKTDMERCQQEIWEKAQAKGIGFASMLDSLTQLMGITMRGQSMEVKKGSDPPPPPLAEQTGKMSKDTT